MPTLDERPLRVRSGHRFVAPARGDGIAIDEVHDG
jgi:hypothetical protein